MITDFRRHIIQVFLPIIIQPVLLKFVINPKYLTNREATP